MPARKMLTRAQRIAREKAIIKDLKAGLMSYRSIALKHKVSLPTVNSKARKAGITRSRRGPAALAASTTMRARRTSVRRKPGRKPGRKPATRKATMWTKTRTTTRRKAGRKTRRYTARATAARRTARGPMASGPRGARAFREQFRSLIMHHYPNISLKAFARLTAAIERSLP